MDTQTHQLILAPDNLPILISKTNVKDFYERAKLAIYENGHDNEAVLKLHELINFFEAIKKLIHGDSASKIEADREFIDFTREVIKRNADKDTFETARGVKFTIAETGTTYDFSGCADPVLNDLERQAKEIAEKIKKQKEFLKAVDSKSGLVITDESTGETYKVYPPVKQSKSSFKVQLPK